MIPPPVCQGGALSIDRNATLMDAWMIMEGCEYVQKK